MTDNPRKTNELMTGLLAEKAPEPANLFTPELEQPVLVAPVSDDPEIATNLDCNSEPPVIRGKTEFGATLDVKSSWPGQSVDFTTGEPIPPPRTGMTGEVESFKIGPGRDGKMLDVTAEPPPAFIPHGKTADGDPLYASVDPATAGDSVDPQFLPKSHRPGIFKPVTMSKKEIAKINLGFIDSAAPSAPTAPPIPQPTPASAILTPPRAWVDPKHDLIPDTVLQEADRQRAVHAQAQRAEADRRHAEDLHTGKKKV